MVRCNNCGWTNESSQTRCEKCNAPLKGSIIGQPGQAEKENNPEPKSTPQTEIGRKASGDYLDFYNVQKCPKCGYPNSTEVVICINCKAPLKDAAASDPENPDFNKGKVHILEKMGKIIRIIGNEHSAESMDISGTIDPYRQKAETKFYLEPLSHEEESKVIIECHGISVNLNRDNLDPGNNSITSKIQAVISIKDGTFYIEDKSQKQTTFIQVNKPYKLENGDIILMGNKKFRFYMDI